MEEARPVAGSSGWMLLGKVFERVVRLVVVVALARMLGVRTFGGYAFALAYAETWCVFADWGLHGVMVRAMARDPTRAPTILGQGIALKAALSLAGWAAASLVAFFALPAGETQGATLVACLFIFVSFRVVSLRAAFEAPFRARLKMTAPTLAWMGAEALSALCLLWAAWRGWSLPALVGVQLLGTLPGVFALLTACLREMRPRLDFRFPLWRRLLAEALPVGAAHLCIIAYARVDLLMLEWMSGAASVGVYAAAYRLTGSVGVLPAALAAALLPVVVRAHAAGGRVADLYRGALSLVTAAALPLAVGGFAFAQEVVSLLYGPAYHGVADALRVLCWTMAVNFSLYVATMFLVALGRERAFLLYGVSLALLNVGLNALLIPRFDFVGAGWASLLTESFMACACLAALARRAGTPPWGAMARAALAALLGGAAALWLPAPALLRAACGLVLYAGCVIWWGGISVEGRSALYSLLPATWRRTPGSRDG